MQRYSLRHVSRAVFAGILIAMRDRRAKVARCIAPVGGGMLAAGGAGAWMAQAICLRGEWRREGSGEKRREAHAPAGRRARGETGNVQRAARLARL